MDTENTPPPPVEPWHRSRMLLRNPISLAGMALAIVSLANIFLFVLIDAIATKPEPLYRDPGVHGVARIPDSWLTADVGWRAHRATKEGCRQRLSILASI